MPPLPSAHACLAFDLEFDRLVPPDEACWADANARPRITCAAAVTSGGEVKVWGEPGPSGAPLDGIAIRHLIAWLWARFTGGSSIVTWGGASSDWRALIASLAVRGDADKGDKVDKAYKGDKADKADKAITAACLAMAAAHIDVPLVAAATLGTMMSLASCAAGMGLGAKCGRTSQAAPSLWASGVPADQRTVLEHVQRDAQLTLDVYRAAMAAEPPTIQWLTQRGRLITWRIPYVGSGDARRSLSVRECASLPPPRTRFASPPAFQVGHATAWMWQALGALVG